MWPCPYWNWSSDRTIPTPFAAPESPLAQAVRYTPHRPLRPAEVDRLSHDPALARLGVAALGAAVFQAASPEAIPASFGGVARPNPGGLAWPQPAGGDSAHRHPQLRRRRARGR